jgi:hypothetical protein
MSVNRKNPITRLNKFFGGEDYNLDISMGREWLNGDMNFTLVLYSVDSARTIKDDVYGEVTSDGIQYQAPVEFKAYVKIAEATNEFINGSRILQNEPGNMTFSVYHKELEELKINIKLGDYIGYWIDENEMRFFSVVDAATPDYDNKHTYGGYKSFYYSYTATPVSATEFDGF